MDAYKSAWRLWPLLSPPPPPSPSVATPDMAVQVTEDCRERGELMADVWIRYTTVLETVMGRINQLCLQDRDRSAKPAVLAGCMGKATSAKCIGVPCRSQSARHVMLGMVSPAWTASVLAAYYLHMQFIA